MYKSNDMRLCQFRFKLPEELIAQFPAPYRDEARMMVLHRKSGEIEHKTLPELVDHFDEGDLFVLNDTKVFPARLWSHKEKTNALIEVFLLRELSHKMRYWDVLVEPARKIRIGNKLTFEEDSAIVAEVIDNTTSRGRTFRFLTDYDNEEFVPRLYALGHAPLPKYIQRPMSPEVFEQYQKAFHDQPVREMDNERYQTIFADKVGAVAAPASGLHFSKQLLKRMEIRGIETTFMTSHVSLGIFKDIDVEDLTKNKMESEQIILPQKMVNAVNHAREEQHRVCALQYPDLRLPVERGARAGRRLWRQLCPPQLRRRGCRLLPRSGPGPYTGGLPRHAGLYPRLCGERRGPDALYHLHHRPGRAAADPAPEGQAGGRPLVQGHHGRKAPRRPCTHPGHDPR